MCIELASSPACTLMPCTINLCKTMLSSQRLSHFIVTEHNKQNKLCLISQALQQIQNGIVKNNYNLNSVQEARQCPNSVFIIKSPDLPGKLSLPVQSAVGLGDLKAPAPVLTPDCPAEKIWTSLFSSSSCETLSACPGLQGLLQWVFGQMSG